jgi:hypothetical protein
LVEERKSQKENENICFYVACYASDSDANYVFKAITKCL